MNSIKFLYNNTRYKMGTILTNSGNSKTSDPHRRLLLNLSDKINLNRSNKYVPLSNKIYQISIKYFQNILCIEEYEKGIQKH